MKVSIRGFATASAKIENVGDLRALVYWLDEYRFSDDVDLDVDSGCVWLDLADGMGELAQCGDHVWPDTRFDVVIPTHKHEE